MVAITVYPEESPRNIFVSSPATQITQQELLNLCRDWEQEPANLPYPKLINSSGKEDLGGGVAVGITNALQNARIAFDARTTSKSSGTATSINAGTILTDTSATFIADGIEPGALIINFSDLSVATVLKIDSEQQITHQQLADGTGNNWEVGDVYKIWNIIQVEATGGNITAVDNSGIGIPSILPTAFTQVVRTSSASATIAELEIVNLQRLIETQRDHHIGTGKIWYYDPVNGNDANDGETPTTAVKTLQYAHDNLCRDNQHDIIMVIPGHPSEVTVADETVNITKDYIFIRGPGRGFKLNPTTTTADTITISGQGIEISGMIVNTATTGSRKAIYVTGTFPLLRNIWIEKSMDVGIHLDGVSSAYLRNIDVKYCTSHGICCEDVIYSHIDGKIIIHYNGGTGIHIMGVSHGMHIYGETDIHKNSGYGLRTEATTKETYLHPDARVYKNVSGQILSEGTDDYIGTGMGTDMIADAVWEEQTSAHITSDSFGEKVGNKLLTTGKFLALK